MQYRKFSHGTEQISVIGMGMGSIHQNNSEDEIEMETTGENFGIYKISFEIKVDSVHKNRYTKKVDGVHKNRRLS